MQIPYKSEPVDITISGKYIGKCLREARLRTKIPKRYLAKYIGINIRDITKIERGQAVIPSEALIKLFCLNMLAQNHA